MGHLATQREVSGRHPAPRRGTPARRRPRGNGQTWWAWLFIGPTVAGLAVFYAWPAIRTLYFSFTEWGPFGGSTWVGGANYVKLATDPDLLRALGNTFVYTAVVLLGIPIAIVVAALLNQNIRGVGVYRTLYFLPVVTMPAAIALVWRMLYNGDYGIINYFLGLIGVHGASWLNDPRTALLAVAVVGIWASIGYNVVIFTAGLKSIPAEIYDAASIDGAGRIRQFRHVTLPLLTPSIFFVSVLTVITTFQVFDLIYIMVPKSSPGLPATRSIVYLFYEAGFVENQRGYAAAVAFVLLAIILVLTVIQFRLQRRWVHYE